MTNPFRGFFSSMSEDQTEVREAQTGMAAFIALAIFIVVASFTTLFG
jgi:hypothetical protein